jgi:chorismate mutase/prephenate dehydratase
MSNIKVAYFGHPGSFSFRAAKKFVAGRGQKAYLYPCETIEEVLDYVNIGESYGVVPTYNSTTGKIEDYLKLVNNSSPLEVDDIILEVHHCLMARRKMDINRVEKIFSHPQAFKQCYGYLKAKVPNAALCPYSTTSTAAHDLAEGILDNGSAVIASDEAAKIYNLVILDSDIQDDKDNTTHFKVLFKRN